MIENKQVRSIIKGALCEDRVRYDITTHTLIPKNLKASARIIAKETGVVCALSIAEFIFRQLDKTLKFKAHFKDGQRIKQGSVLADISGKAGPILQAERTALNFLSYLSGVASYTNEFVSRVKPYKANILDTRKTTPNLRILEKYAVKCGGGFNHRFDLGEQVLIKDNHLSLSRIAYFVSRQGTIKEIIEKTRKRIKNKRIKIEVEVNNIKEFNDALSGLPDIIMLDNFSLADIKKAVALRGKHKTPQLEVSGGVKLANVKKIAACGVERISIGALTHSVKSLDLSLEIIQ
ncbi:MAG TPA: carboxylating nicotinate-nucleotide diphosphorylase [Candidatus Omnitrophica bacterium]|nr:carboxylating nicotinate-nucleotide diphosphorylase [Candidatus Omnitrophota bacterium]